MWRSDGTDLDTKLVKDILLQASSDPQELINVGGALFFTAESELGRELWRSDGTESNTKLVKNIAPDVDAYWLNDAPQLLTNLGGTLAFAADDGVTGVEPWISNGSGNGTVLAADVLLGPGSSSPSGFVRLGSKMLFAAADPVAGRELWTLTLPGPPPPPDPPVAAAPIIANLSGPASELPLGSPADLSVLFFDSNAGDTHTWDFAWDDGSTSLNVPTTSPTTCASSHAFSNPGTYTVSVLVRVSTGKSDSDVHEVVVLAPEGPPQPPAILPAGVVLISPLSIVTAFGSGFSIETIESGVLDGDGKLATILGGTCVEIGGERAPMFAVTPTQLNVQTSGSAPLGPIDVVVIRDCDMESETRSAVEMATVEPTTPGFFLFPPYAEDGFIAARFNEGFAAVAPVCRPRRTGSASISTLALGPPLWRLQQVLLAAGNR